MGSVRGWTKLEQGVLGSRKLRGNRREYRDAQSAGMLVQFCIFDDFTSDSVNSTCTVYPSVQRRAMIRDGMID
jgi:hypothetical protein